MNIICTLEHLYKRYKMIIPVRCFTCNYPISSKWNKYKSMVSNNVHPSEVFKVLCIKRYCCKRMLLSHEDVIDRILNHEQQFNYVKEYNNTKI